MEIMVSNGKTPTVYWPHHDLSVLVLIPYIRFADAIRIQGTMPFLSLRVLKCWHHDQVHAHTAIDDLESFVWVLVWCILSINGSNTPDEELRIGVLRSTNMTSHIVLKEGLLQALWESAERKRASSMVQIFGPFLKTCRTITSASSFAIESRLEDQESVDINEELRTLTYKYFGEFLSAGAEYLAELPTSWPPGTVPVPS
jgi:hypothetical protein